MRWIALTGVNGFIGHNLLTEFLNKTPQTLDLEIDEVLGTDLETSLDRSTYRATASRQGYEFCLMDNFLEKLESNHRAYGCPPLALIHNGACSSTTETDPEVFRTLNLESSQQLFHYCATKRVPFLYASSASVYGDGSSGFSDTIENNDLYTPLNLYGRSKHQFDSWVLRQEQKPLFWFGLRYFNVFGPHETHKKSQASVLHWGRRQIEQSGSMTLYRSHRDDIADGEQRRDFVSVFDIVRVTLNLLQRGGQDLTQNGCFVNIGRGRATSWIETAEALFRALGRPVDLKFIDMPEALRAHYQNYTQADLHTLHSLGITESFLPLEEAFRKSMETQR